MATLIDSIRSKDPKAIRFLLDGGADVNAFFGEYTPLGLAVEIGDIRIVKALLAAGADANRGGIVYPLHEAVQSKRISIVEALLKAGAEVNQVAEYGTTPLMMAVFSGSEKAVHLLLESNADANLQNGNLETAYEIALENRKHKIASILAPISDPAILEKFKSSPKLTLLAEAAESGDTKELLRIIDTGVDVNAVALKRPDNALTEACRKGHLNAVEVLLNAGASPNIYGYWPPLAPASFRGDIPIIHTLINAEVNVNALSGDGESALMRAAEESHLEAAKLLIDANANVNAVGRIGKTPLSQAYDYEWRYRKRNPVVDLLLDCGAVELGEYTKAYSNWVRPRK